MENQAMNLLKSIEATTNKILARITQDQAEQRRVITAMMAMVEANGKGIQRLTAQIPQQNREGARYDIRHVQGQYRDRPHYVDQREPEVKRRLAEQVKGYAQTIRAVESERRPWQPEPFRELFSGKFQQETPNQDYRIPRASNSTHNRSRDSQTSAVSDPRSSTPYPTLHLRTPDEGEWVSKRTKPVQPETAVEVLPSTSRQVTQNMAVTVAYTPTRRPKRLVNMEQLRRQMENGKRKRAEARRTAREEDFENAGSPKVTVNME
jgi:hypothetical protein